MSRRTTISTDNLSNLFDDPETADLDEEEVEGLEKFDNDWLDAFEAWQDADEDPEDLDSLFREFEELDEEGPPPDLGEDY